MRHLALLLALKSLSMSHPSCQKLWKGQLSIDAREPYVQDGSFCNIHRAPCICCVRPAWSFSSGTIPLQNAYGPIARVSWGHTYPGERVNEVYMTYS